MKLYDVKLAPSPRRVRIFVAEKNIPMEFHPVDLKAGEQRSPAFLAMHPSGKVPVLETDHGEFIGESVAICRYLEALHPKPNLMGESPYEQARVEMFNRILDLELYTAIGVSWVNGPVVARLAPGRHKQIPEAKEASDARVIGFYKRMNRELGERAFMAGERFTIADITALTAVDFATTMLELKPADTLENLWRWYEKVDARPSARA